jgi:hypothetical protein
MYAGCNTKYQITNTKSLFISHPNKQLGNPPKPNFEIRNQNMNFDCSLSLTKQGIKAQVVKTSRCDQEEGTAVKGMWERP